VRERPLIERRRQLTAARAAEEKTQLAVAQQERELAELRDKGVRLRQFVRDRALSSDYTQELGVISKMRRDLEELVSLLPNAEDAARAQPLAIAASVADRVPEVERIILYIDDLDRCPAHKVVEVLQAVHLLLAFKLFVVVVGVDSRWLQRSLRHHYGELLDNADDYLEKIFQIPFIVRSMTPAVYRRLIAELTAKRAAPAPAGDDGSEHATFEDQRGDGGPSASNGDEVAASAPSGGAQDNERDAPLPRPQSLAISASESEVLGQLGDLIPNPRAAKRLVNVYRMLRVSVPAAETATFAPEGQREYQAVVLLLGILVGLPDSVAEVFEAIERAREPLCIWDVIAELPDVAARVEHLRPHIDVTELAPYRRWMPRVARFSFRTAARAAT
jgi:hypothetical protein